MFDTLKRIIPVSVKDTIKKQRLSVRFIVERIDLSSEFPNAGLLADEDIFIARK